MPPRRPCKRGPSRCANRPLVVPRLRDAEGAAAEQVLFARREADSRQDRKGRKEEKILPALVCCFRPLVAAWLGVNPRWFFFAPAASFACGLGMVLFPGRTFPGHNLKMAVVQLTSISASARLWSIRSRLSNKRSPASLGLPPELVKSLQTTCTRYSS